LTHDHLIKFFYLFFKKIEKKKKKKKKRRRRRREREKKKCSHPLWELQPSFFMFLFKAKTLFSKGTNYEGLVADKPIIYQAEVARNILTSSLICRDH
jgi:hypothetical protein